MDIFRWLGSPMQIRIDFLCRDSTPAFMFCSAFTMFSSLGLFVAGRQCILASGTSQIRMSAPHTSKLSRRSRQQMRKPYRVYLDDCA